MVLLVLSNIHAYLIHIVQIISSAFKNHIQYNDREFLFFVKYILYNESILQCS